MIAVVTAERSDAEEIRKIAEEAGIDAWTTADYKMEIGRDDSLVLTARDTEIAGFLLARLVPGTAASKDADLYNIAVRKACRREGIGSKLLTDLLSKLNVKRVENVWLEVRESNHSAIRFYKSHGFVAELTRPNFYRDPIENAVIMRLHLSRHCDVTRP